jgi:hypothetical protein
MAKIYAQTVVLLLILSFTVSASLLSYDPTVSSSTVTLLQKNPYAFRWLYKRLTGGVNSIEVSSLDLEAASPSNKISTRTYNAGANDFTFKAVSPSYTCALLLSGTTKFSLIKFSGNDQLQEDLITSQFIASGAIAAETAKTYQIADGCVAFSADAATYRYDSAATTTTKFVADSATTWTAPAFNAQFSFAAANDGVYIYNAKTTSTPGNFARVLAQTFLTNKRVWTTTSAIVVLSWDSAGTGDVKNFKVHAIARPATGQSAYTLVGTIEGQFYNTVAGASPEISVSTSLELITVYGKSGAATFFSKVKRFNYAAKTATDITLPPWVTEAESTMSVVNGFIYVRNAVNHGAFHIDSFGAGLYLGRALSNT